MKKLTQKPEPKKAARVRKPRPNVSDYLTAFTMFLSNRSRPIVFSAFHEVPTVIEILQAFVKVNNLPEPVNQKSVKFPEGVEHLTNMPEENKNKTVKQLTIDEVLERCLSMIRDQHGKDQNQIIAVILNEMENDRKEHVKGLQKEMDVKREVLEAAINLHDGFNQVRNYGFEKLNFR